MELSCIARKVHWERVNLYIDFEVSPLPYSDLPYRYLGHQHIVWSEDLDGIEFHLQTDEETYVLKVIPGKAPNSYQLALNVTNFSQRQEIPNGTWRIFPVMNGQQGLPMTIEPEQAQYLSQWSKAFMFDRNRQSYLVSFDLSDDDERPDFVIRTYHYTAVSIRNRTSQIRRILSRVRASNCWRLLQLWYNFCRLIPHSRPRVLFAAQQRSKLEGNLLQVHNRMVERQLDKTFKLRKWTDLRNNDVADRVLSRLRLARMMATSDIVFLDDYCRLLDFIDLNPKTILVQLWHAGYGFKAVGFSRFGRYGSPVLESGHRKYTYAICGSTKLQSIYGEVFGIEEEAVLATGLPRIDSFLDAQRMMEVREEFYVKYPNLTNKQVVVFAPTFRGKNRNDAHYDYSMIDFEALFDWCGDERVVLFRMHPFIQEAPPIKIDHQDRLYNFASYPSTNDLLYVADVLVTDYSSVVYEYSLLNRPILFYAYDEKAYQTTRGFHGDFRELAPGKICNTFAELLKALSEQDYEFEKVADYRDKYFDFIDTGSTDRVIDQIVVASQQDINQSR